jgi:CBS-domain-containing membrane protein
VVGVACHFIWPGQYVMAAAAIGLAIMAMMVLRVVHPPAGATAIVAYLTATSWLFIVFPVLVGSILLVGLALVYHQVTDNIYPLHHPDHRHRS